MSDTAFGWTGVIEGLEEFQDIGQPMPAQYYDLDGFRKFANRAILRRRQTTYIKNVKSRAQSRKIPKGVSATHEQLVIKIMEYLIRVIRVEEIMKTGEDPLDEFAYEKIIDMNLIESTLDYYHIR